MLSRYRNIHSLTNIFRHIWYRRSPTGLYGSKISHYSTIVPKCCFDVIDLFTEILLFNRQRTSAEKCNTVVDRLTSSPPNNKVLKVNEEIFTHIDYADKIKAEVALEAILKKSIDDKNWPNVIRITEVCTAENIPMNRNLMRELIKIFSDTGYLKGLLPIRVLFCTTHPDEYIENGELLMQLARCYWMAGNSRECFVRVDECLRKYPELKDTSKAYLKNIISEAVLHRSEAELRCTVSFVEEYCDRNDDLYLLVILWNYLFLSHWFTDQKLADELLNRHDYLRSNISLMASSLTRFFITHNQIQDVYRLLQIFLKYKMTESYGLVSQILFDYYCRKGDQSACSEIVKTSVRLKSPLREEQYNYFISWCATGDPFKCISATEIQKIYSKF